MGPKIKAKVCHSNKYQKVDFKLPRLAKLTHPLNAWNEPLPVPLAAHLKYSVLQQEFSISALVLANHSKQQWLQDI